MKIFLTPRKYIRSSIRQQVKNCSVRVKRYILILGLLYPFSAQLLAQRSCAAHTYLSNELQQDPGLLHRMQLPVPTVTVQDNTPDAASPIVYRIPVVIHILYKEGDAPVTDEQVISQIAALNRDFRKQNADTQFIPAAFSARAADAHIEFVLARADPQGRATSGILRKRTSIQFFSIDDRIKSSAHGGQDGWNASQYLNIWVGNMAGGLLGYASPVGGAPEKDGVVIHTGAFGSMGTAKAPYNKGRTTTHEVGHWLGLQHIWGDMYCGDDGVDDTPPQRSSSRGCPKGIISTCDNGTTGDMYMNYMDFTDDACTNLFTKGQVARMRALFVNGGQRQVLLASNALTDNPLPALPEEQEETEGTALLIRLYPNPTPDLLTITGNLPMVGKRLTVVNHTGQLVYQARIGKSTLQVPVRQWQEGLYFVKVEGSKPQKFIKAR
ncbi:MAG: M43 family zinc metalloprotease [Candidatus Pseudobacter hemicellulosilyticus]|uniref:M43 family zinc metalloprotease n=1 Tax=Candidatus Pseudobacter hemicellulosilyticus TaxID=3121375 RepID=A0AAJ5WT59_9BACT|nr:MAG: M43 family zinc metalloprotease [Pseudobacter sp.]